MDRRTGFGIVAAVLAVVVTAALVEGVLRVVNPTPRVQVVRLDAPHVHTAEADGVTLFWDDRFGDLVRGGPCQPGQPVVGVFGDSVQLVSGEGFDDPRTATLLQARLAADGVDACVLDTSWAGWKPQQVLAMLRRTHATTPIDVAVVGVWKADERYTRLGELLIDGEVVANDAGVPRSPLPLPGAAHRWLLQRSTAWRTLTLALARPAPPPRPPDAAYREALAWGADAGVPMVFLEGVWLDRPFAQSRAERDPASWQAALQADAAAAGQGWVWLGDALEGLDLQAVRIDTCCHVRVPGHQRAADALAPLVEAALAARAKAAVTSPGTGPR